MVVVCQILINKPGEDVHRAGEIVSGVVKYAMDRPMEYKDIILSFKGESWCSWSVSGDVDKSTAYIGTDEHVSYVMSLLNSTGETRILPAGAYQQKFIFLLPKIIPPSFNGPTGCVLYKMSLVFKRQGMCNTTRRFELEIPVRNYLDPMLPDIPIAFAVNKTLFKPLTMGNQEIRLKAEIARPCIRPGEKAELKLTITNDSIVRIKSIRAELIRTTVYTANCGAKTTETQKIKNCAAETGKVRPRNTVDISISVPILAEHCTVQHSKVISNEYNILVTVKVPVPRCKITTSVPILIGERENIGASRVNEEIELFNEFEANKPPPTYFEAMIMTKRKEAKRALLIKT